MVWDIDTKAVMKPIVDCANNDCVIAIVSAVSTCMGYIPTYDKYGNPLGRDPNYTTYSYKCYKCSREWVEQK